jgi:hypothetical protein
MPDSKSLDQWSNLGMYGDRELFRRLNLEGFTEMNFGGGEWSHDFRIVAIFTAFHPDGRIWTYQHPKSRPDGHTSFRGTPFEQTFNTKAEFDQYCQENEIIFAATNAPMEKVLAEYDIDA